MSSIFLSHSHKDKLFVRKLSKRLEEHGIQTWLDEIEMQVGDSIITKIGDAIREYRYLGVVISSHSVSSEWVRREVNIALTEEIQARRTKVLPLLCERCELPAFLVDKIYADFTGDFDEGFNRLLDRLLADNFGESQSGHSEAPLLRSKRKFPKLIISVAVLALLLGLVCLGIYFSTLDPREQVTSASSNKEGREKSLEDRKPDNQLGSISNANQGFREFVNDNQNEQRKGYRNNTSGIEKQTSSRLARTLSLSTAQLDRARKLLRQGDYQKAIGICDGILKNDPHNSLAHKIKAEALYAADY